MQSRRASLVLSVVLIFCFCSTAISQQPATTLPFGYSAGRLESVKLLTQEVGWAATRTHLFWTANDGKQWNDITPQPAIPGEIVSAVFFLDASTGWALLAGSDDAGRNRFDLASTLDSGAHWSLSRVNTSGLTPAEASLTGDGYMYFLDSAHGWINLSVASGSAFHPGAALATQDGGKTWNWVPMGSGSAGPIMFTTLKDGWILSPDHTELDVTHDGSKSWQEVKLHAPILAHAGTGEAYGYDLPTFEDAGHGFLMAGFADSDRMALFTTADGGLTWKAEGVLPHTEESETAISHSSWIAAAIPLHGSWLTLTTVPLRNIASRPTAVRADISRIAGTHALGGNAEYLGFSDDAHGWVLAGEMLATSDGGTTWSDITPAGARPAVRTEGTAPRSVGSPNAIDRSEPRSRRVAGIQAAQPGASPGVQAALGFDKSLVLCAPYPNCTTQQSINYMLAWANTAPYLVTSLYLPSQNHPTDHYLTAAWVTAIQQQGWGLVPIWVGLQSPCACKPGSQGTWPTCTTFAPNTIGPDTASAASQGTADAKNAEKVAAGLASGVAVIYKDIENYNPSSVLSNGARCGDVVNSYLSSWDAQLHNDFYASGVYGNPTPAVDWQAHVLPLPSNAWIAQYPATGKPPNVSIWNLGASYGMTDSMWPSYQRIHQYSNTHNEAWGGTPSFGIDGDIVNAEIVSNNNVTTYNYQYSSVDCSNLGAMNTYPLGINDMSNGVMINGPGQTGTTVGHLLDSSYKSHGFQSSGGVCSYVDVTGALATVAVGINNLGEIVGYFQDAGLNLHGFLQNPGKLLVQVDYPGASATEFYGVNDAGQIIGSSSTASGSNYAVQNFLYYGGQFYSVGSGGSGNSRTPGASRAKRQSRDISTIAATSRKLYSRPALPQTGAGTSFPSSPAAHPAPPLGTASTPITNWSVKLSTPRLALPSAASCGREAYS
jgi:probable HAF family extracellular repeat protein